MLDTLLAALHGADPFEAAHGVGADEARRVLAEQWRELDRLAAADPAGYARHLEAAARGAGVALPSGALDRAASAAAAAAAASASASAHSAQRAGPAASQAPVPAAAQEQQQKQQQQTSKGAAGSLLEQLATCAAPSGAAKERRRPSGVRRPLVEEVGGADAGGCRSTGAHTASAAAAAAPAASTAAPSSLPPQHAAVAAPLAHDVAVVVRSGDGARRVVRVTVSGLHPGVPASDVVVEADGPTAIVVTVGRQLRHRIPLPVACAAEAAVAKLDAARGRLVLRLSPLL